ncbi:MAG: XrtA/PEP-CTERM system histidine kinase PrsK [Pseudomonadales bacterium]
MTIEAFSLVCGSIGVAAYLALLTFCIITLIRGITGRALLAAATATLLFVTAVLLTGESAYTQVLEFASLFAWIVLLVRAIGLNSKNYRDEGLQTVTFLTGAAFLVTLGGLISILTTPAAMLYSRAVFIPEVLLNVLGLVLVEQLVKNTRVDLRPKLRFLNIGLGLIFVYGLFNSTLSLMYSAYIPVLDIIQPVVLALATPFLAISSLRNRDNQLRFNVSRRFVFKSGVLIAAGLVLLLMGLVGYYFRLAGGDIAAAAVLLATTLLILMAVTIGGSEQFRLRSRRWVSRNLLRARHDYRARWEDVTRQLTEPHPDFSLEQQAIRALIDLFGARGGSLWWLKDGRLEHLAAHHSHWTGPMQPALKDAITVLLLNAESAVDRAEMLASNHGSIYRTLIDDIGIWYLVPLRVHGALVGVVGINRPIVPQTLSDEDRDVIRLVSREVAGFLALHRADLELGTSRQFDALNRMTTYLIHDIKTSAAQLALLVQNAERHKTNPAFIEDMLATVRNATSRMTELIRQIDSGARGTPDTRPFKLKPMLDEVLDRYAGTPNKPRLTCCPDEALVHADRNRLRESVTHLVSNAVDATAKGGAVELRVEADGPWIAIEVKDTGCGMTPEFIENHLFEPFRSTKGVAGMGVGAHQVREYTRSLGGDVVVESRPGVGSTFTIKLPGVMHD